MVAEFYEQNGIISGDAASPDTVSGGKGRDVLVSGNEDGSANTAFQRFFGGEGSDAFVFRARDFSADTSQVVTKHIADFQGASGWSATNNDFISFTGFGSAFEGNPELRLAKTFDANPENPQKLYTYEIVVGDDVVGTFLLNSLNGKTLGAGDYAFYG